MQRKANTHAATPSESQSANRTVTSVFHHSTGWGSVELRYREASGSVFRRSLRRRSERLRLWRRQTESTRQPCHKWRRGFLFPARFSAGWGRILSACPQVSSSVNQPFVRLPPGTVMWKERIVATAFPLHMSSSPRVWFGAGLRIETSGERRPQCRLSFRSCILHS